MERMNTQASLPRWENYVLDSGEDVVELWKTCFLSPSKKVLFVLGKGFDPRMCNGVKKFLEVVPITKEMFDVLVIDFHEGESSPSHQHDDEIVNNWQDLENACRGRANIIIETILVRSTDGRRRVASINASKIVGNLDRLSAYSDVIVDISALPRAIYFPLIASALEIADENNKGSDPGHLNVHVLVSEDSNLDKLIKEEGIEEDAQLIHGFAGGLDMEATSDLPTVWIPLLGEGQRTQLDRIVNFITPDEACPIFPSPSTDPRRGDNLIFEYHGLFFDGLRGDPRNFIFASEKNPYEVYLQIRRTALQFRQALEPIGGCKVALSAHSSKLLSVGALLAAYELKSLGEEVGVVHVESQGYVMDAEAKEYSVSENAELYNLWLAGQCYDN